MWDWAGQAPFVAMALLVANDLTRVRMNMTAVAQKVRMRAFLREADALGWLDGAERRRPTTEISKVESRLHMRSRDRTADRGRTVVIGSAAARAPLERVVAGRGRSARRARDPSSGTRSSMRPW